MEDFLNRFRVRVQAGLQFGLSGLGPRFLFTNPIRVPLTVPFITGVVRLYLEALSIGNPVFLGFLGIML